MAASPAGRSLALQEAPLPSPMEATKGRLLPTLSDGVGLDLSCELRESLENGLAVLRGRIDAEIAQLLVLLRAAGEFETLDVAATERARLVASAECPAPPTVLLAGVSDIGAPSQTPVCLAPATHRWPGLPLGSPSKPPLSSIPEDMGSDDEVPHPPSSPSACQTQSAFTASDVEDLPFQGEHSDKDAGIEGNIETAPSAAWGRGVTPCFGQTASEKSHGSRDGSRKLPNNWLALETPPTGEAQETPTSEQTTPKGTPIPRRPLVPILHQGSQASDSEHKSAIARSSQEGYIRNLSRVSFPAGATVSETHSSVSAILYEEERQAREMAMQSACLEEQKARSRVDYGAVQPYWQRVVEGPTFEMAIAVLIVTNAMIIGAEVQWQANNLGEVVPLPFYIVQHCYATLFLLELLLRIRAYGFGALFCTTKVGWVHMDAFIVVAALFEMAFDIFLLSGGDKFQSIAGISQLRIVRMIRVTRIVRTFRIQRIIRVVAPLRTLVFSIAVTLKSLLWAMVLLGIIIYAVSIIMAQSASEAIIDGCEPDIEGGLREYWFSLDRAMYTLFQSISGGISWRDSVQSLEGFVACIFTVYIGFVYFAVLNVVTGVFCSCAIETTQRNPEVIATSMIKNKQTYVENLKSFFKNMDKDGSGMITLTEFESMLKDEMMCAHLMALEIDTSDAWTLFKLIDNDKSGVIEIDEFVAGCEQLKGGAKGVDVANIQAELKSLTKRLVKFMRYTEDQLETVTGVPGVTKARSTATAKSRDTASGSKRGGHFFDNSLSAELAEAVDDRPAAATTRSVHSA